MILLDLFSGYGGFHLALEQAGFEFEEVYFSEIDKHAIANYLYNFPNAKYAGPIQSVSRNNMPKADIITFGWPCQDNSIAGKRRGQQEGTRSGLLGQAVRCISEHWPRHFFAENVPGLLSVNKGIGFIKAIEILCVFNESCPQYDIEMQLFNTKQFLPQNRERLFFVGHLRGTGCREVFPIGEEIGGFNEGAIKAPIVRTIMGGGANREACTAQ
jgi:DNA (cytosine-5)-methyltransferase 1